MHVNNQWDLEYKELEAAFSRYRIDSQQAQAENQTVIEKVKEAKESMAEEIRKLQAVISRRDKDVTELRGKVRSLEEQLGGSRFRYGQPMVSHERIKELEEESHILRQQVSTFCIVQSSCFGWFSCFLVTRYCLSVSLCSNFLESYLDFSSIELSMWAWHF